jgi:hypothetical protein
MPITIQVPDGLLSIALYPVGPPPEARGRARVEVTLPRGTLYQLHPDAVGWATVLITASREDALVGVDISIADAPGEYPLISQVRWNQDEEVQRGPSTAGARFVLDGLDRRVMRGYKIEEPGDPSRAPGFIPVDDGG